MIVYMLDWSADYEISLSANEKNIGTHLVSEYGNIYLVSEFVRCMR